MTKRSCLGSLWNALWRPSWSSGPSRRPASTFAGARESTKPKLFKDLVEARLCSSFLGVSSGQEEREEQEHLGRVGPGGPYPCARHPATKVCHLMLHPVQRLHLNRPQSSSLGPGCTVVLAGRSLHPGGVSTSTYTRVVTYTLLPWSPNSFSKYILLYDRKLIYTMEQGANLTLARSHHPQQCTGGAGEAS